MKIITVVLCALLLAACSNNAPEPKKAKGEWYELNTTIQAVKTGTM